MHVPVLVDRLLLVAMSSTDFDKTYGVFFKEKLTQSQEDLLGFLNGCFSFLYKAFKYDKNISH